MPKLVNGVTGAPEAVWLLRCTVNKSKPRCGLNPASLSVSVSLSAPRVTVAEAVGVVDAFLRMHGANAAFGNKLKCFDDTGWAPNAECAPTAAVPRMTADATTRDNFTMRLCPFEG